MNGLEQERNRGRRFALRLLFVAVASVWGMLVWRAITPPAIVNVKLVPPQDLVLCGAGTLRRLAPPHESVPIDAFYIDRYEVRERDYENFLREVPSHPSPPHWPERRGDPRDRDLPMIWVSLVDARAFARHYGKRLPTCDEWEWAAIADRRTPFPWGRLSDDAKANTWELNLWRRTPTGLFRDGASAFGVYDMVGNVREWTESRALGYDELYFLRGGSFADPLITADRRTALETHTLVSREFTDWEVDPETKEFRGTTRVVREPRPIVEHLAGPDARSAHWGFRCVTDVHSYEKRQERQRRLQSHIENLGAKDPISYVLVTWPALRALRAARAEARPLIRACLQSRQDDTVRERLMSLLKEASP
jgi:hypothetical protein